MDILSALLGIRTADAWTGETHQAIVYDALELMEKEKKLRPFSFFREHIDKLQTGCVAPDQEGDPDKGPGLHYYSCMDPKGRPLSAENGYYRNRLGELSPSLRTLFRDNYTSALSLYKSGRTEVAMFFLGRAIHFVSDLGCTPHTCNVKYQDKASNLHFAFERSANTVKGRFKAEGFDKRLMKLYTRSDPGEALNRLCALSAKYLENVSTLDPRAFEEAASHTLPATVQHVVALMLAFYEDTQTDRGNFVPDGRQVTVKNEATGLTLTAGPKGIFLEEPAKGLDQRLRVSLSDGGTFTFAANDGRTVAAGFKGLETVKGTAAPAQFRLGALGNRRFVITDGIPASFRVLSNLRGGKLGIDGFKPDNPLQVWVIL